MEWSFLVLIHHFHIVAWSVGVILCNCLCSTSLYTMAWLTVLARQVPGHTKTYVIIARPLPQFQGLLSFLSLYVGNLERKKAIPVLKELSQGEIHVNK